MNTHYYMGVDGGGSKTVCLLSDESGRIIGRGVAGPSNYHVVGVEQTQRALRACMQEAIAQSGRNITDIYSSALGMAGVDRPDDHLMITRTLDSLDLSFLLRTLHNDAVIALAGATVAEPGVVIISGTGSIAFGINQRGEHSRAGGWGHILGDEGSGYDIGRQALVAVVRDADGRGPRTMLKPTILDHLNLTDAPQLIGRVYEQSMERHEIADLTRLVAEVANRGDQVAQEILAYAAEELAISANAVIRALGMERDEFDIALVGGVFGGRGAMADVISRLTREVAPISRVVMPRFEPVVGALLLAMRQANIDLTPELIDNIVATSRKG